MEFEGTFGLKQKFFMLYCAHFLRKTNHILIECYGEPLGMSTIDFIEHLNWFEKTDKEIISLFWSFEQIFTQCNRNDGSLPIILSFLPQVPEGVVAVCSNTVGIQILLIL